MRTIHMKMLMVAGVLAVSATGNAQETDLYRPDAAEWMDTKVKNSPKVNARTTNIKTTEVNLTLESAPYNGMRTITSAESKSLISLTSKLRFQTLVILPDDEEIMEAFGGDQEFWPTSFSKNLLLFKPAKANSETNLNVTTAKGTVYSFMLRENSKVTPDLRVTIEADQALAHVKPKFVSMERYEQLQAQLDDIQLRMTETKAAADTQVQQAQRAAPSKMHFDYAPWVNKPPFIVKAMWHDEAFTYIVVDMQELPSLYELKDNEPAVVNFQVEDNGNGDSVFIVPKVIDFAYLTLGKMNKKDRFIIRRVQ